MRAEPSSAPVHDSETMPSLRGSAAREVARLGDRAVMCDLYDARGSQIYHDTGSLDTSEIRELSRLVRARPGPVLELAAGSGRLTLPLLKLGRPLTALELSASMVGLLRHAADGARGAERLEVVRGDMSDFDLGRTFGVVVVGASSVSLLDHEGRRGFYDSVRRHLDDEGALLVSVAETLPSDGDVCDEQYDLRGRSGRGYRLHQYWEAGEQTRTVCVYPVSDIGGEVPVCLSTPGVLTKETVISEMAGAGLAVVAQYPVAGSGQIIRDVMLEVEKR